MVSDASTADSGVTLSTGTVLHAHAVLVAAGRTPNTEGLGLEEAGVRIDARGRILVDSYFRTTAPGIYATGDVVRPGLASNAMQQGRAAAAHACGLVFGVEIDQIASSAVHGLPEVAGVGATEEQIPGRRAPTPTRTCSRCRRSPHRTVYGAPVNTRRARESRTPTTATPERATHGLIT
jgi:NAD(P) transhydrogenase